MAFQIVKARREAAYIKMAVAGVSGSGKTVGSLLVGYGMMKAAHPELSEAEIWQKILIIDTENRSGSLYVGQSIAGCRIGEYYTIDFGEPYTPQRYIEAIRSAEEAGIEFLVIDSLSHAWVGSGGMLEMQSNVAKKTGNSYTAWRDVSPLHARLIDTIMQCRMHVMITLRSKKEYVIEQNDRGKSAPRAVGMAPVFRDGVEYEVTTFFEVDNSHMASAAKDRTNLFDGQFFILDTGVGKKIYEWVKGGVEERPTPMPASPHETEPPAEAGCPLQNVDSSSPSHMTDALYAQKIAALSSERIAILNDGLVSKFGTLHAEDLESTEKIREMYLFIKSF